MLPGGAAAPAEGPARAKGCRARRGGQSRGRGRECNRGCGADVRRALRFGTIDPGSLGSAPGPPRIVGTKRAARETWCDVRERRRTSASEHHIVRFLSSFDHVDAAAVGSPGNLPRARGGRRARLVRAGLPAARLRARRRRPLDRPDAGALPPRGPRGPGGGAPCDAPSPAGTATASATASWTPPAPSARCSRCWRRASTRGTSTARRTATAGPSPTTTGPRSRTAPCTTDGRSSGSGC